jgi:hypothetical protein
MKQQNSPSYIGVKPQVNGFAVSIFRMGVYRTVGTFPTAEQASFMALSLIFGRNT